MNKFSFAAFAALAMFAPPSALQAQLAVGVTAPAFSTQAALAGKDYAFNLRSALRQGPVVLYFYPRAFTQGCTLETRAFAEVHDQFAAAGATVIGMSADNIDTLKRFSTEACRGKFAVGVATPDIIRAYDVALQRQGMPGGMANRVSYVIGQDGHVRFVHSNLDYRDHVRLTLDALRALKPSN